MTDSRTLVKSGNRYIWFAALAAVILIGALFRFLYLGNMFQSNDNVELADRILRKPGYVWMMFEYYGVIISLWVKICAGIISFFTPLNEFWWKSSVALAGVIHIALTVWLFRRTGHSRFISGFAALLIAALPLHVFQSRYLWGYEVTGALFFCLFFYYLAKYAEAPSRRTGIHASLAWGFYMLSHGYFLPVAPSIAVILLVFRKEGRLTTRIVNGTKDFFTHFLWLFPLLFFVLWNRPLRHSLAKKAHTGFFVDDYFTDFVGNFGWPLFIMVFVIIAAGCIVPAWRSKWGIAVAGCGFWYMAPLFFATPPGITVVRGYMLVGVVCFVLASVFFLASMSGSWKKAATALYVVVFALTCFGLTIAQFRRPLGYPELPSFGIMTERGSIPPDVGTKAAGAYLRSVLGKDDAVLAMHSCIEEPNFRYYFGKIKGYAWNDVVPYRWDSLYNKLADSASILICDNQRMSFAEENPGWMKLADFSNDAGQMMIVFTKRRDIPPPATQDVPYWNHVFDSLYSPRVNLFR